jgi:hypothetical protein
MEGDKSGNTTHADQYPGATKLGMTMPLIIDFVKGINERRFPMMAEMAASRPTNLEILPSSSTNEPLKRASKA